MSPKNSPADAAVNSTGWEDRWLKLPAATLAVLRAHLEAMELEGSVHRWSPEQRALAFPSTVGRITRYGTLFELVWNKQHAMRHSYATWMLEAGADLRWVKDQFGHASIEETEGTYGHLERERHEAWVEPGQGTGGCPLTSTGVHVA